MSPHEAPEIEELPPPEWLEPLAAIPLWLIEVWPIVVLILALAWMHRRRIVPNKWDGDRTRDANNS